MSKTKGDWMNRLASNILQKDDLQKIKGGKKAKKSKKEEEAEKLCKEAWDHAKKMSKKHGWKLDWETGNGNGIW